NESTIKDPRSSISRLDSFTDDEFDAEGEPAKVGFVEGERDAVRVLTERVRDDAPLRFAGHTEVLRKAIFGAAEGLKASVCLADVFIVGGEVRCFFVLVPSDTAAGVGNQLGFLQPEAIAAGHLEWCHFDCRRDSEIEDLIVE